MVQVYDKLKHVIALHPFLRYSMKIMIFPKQAYDILDLTDPWARPYHGECD